MINELGQSVSGIETTPIVTGRDKEPIRREIRFDSNLVCPDCGVSLVRLGTCFTCPRCGFGGCE
nr:hypothetical protein [candidate division Zixibacteria bacterium]